MDSVDESTRLVKCPVLLVAGAFAVGILLVHPEDQPLSTIIRNAGLFLAFATVCLATGLAVLRFERPGISALLALAGFGLAGSASSFLFAARFPPGHIRYLENSGFDLGRPIRVEGTVVSTPLRNPDGLQFDVEVNAIDAGDAGASSRPATGRVHLRLDTSNDPSAWSEIDSLHLQNADRIRALASLRRPKVYRNPGGFDFRWWMESVEDLYRVGTIKNPALVEKSPAATGLTIGNVIERTRQRLLQAIDDLYPPWSAQVRDGAVLKAVLLGERASLDSATIEGFRRSGLYHLLVIAGLHIGLLALIATFLLRFLPLSAASRSVLLLIFLAAYAALVEQRTATLRATLMVFVYLIARLVYRERSLLNAIGIAALILLIHRPAWLLESGFQLSFSAVLIIAGLAAPILLRTTEPYRRALWNVNDLAPDIRFVPRQAQFRLEIRAAIAALKSRVGILDRHPALATAAVTGPVRLLLWTVNILLFSAVLQTGLLLPMAETFHRVTIAGIGLNALAIPVMVTLLVVSIPTVLLAAVYPPLAVWPSKVAALALRCLFTLTEFPRLAHWLSFRVPAPPAWVAFAFAFALVMAAVALEWRPRISWAALVCAALFALVISLHPFPPQIPIGVLEVTVLDCGGGDAVFIVLPDRTTMLIDAGGSRSRNMREGTFQARRWDPGEEIVSPYLWSRGIKKVDIAALSDARGDPEAMATIVRNLRVGEFWYGGNEFAPSLQDLTNVVRERAIPARRITAGETLTRGTTSIAILNPAPDPSPPEAPSAGDDSLVLRISEGEAGVLLPGNSSARVERALTRSSNLLLSPVLKVARQGAKSSTTAEFLERVRPQVALISAESGGRGEPNPETLDRLRAIGARVYRTDLSGAVTVTMREGAISVQTYGTSPAD